MTYAAPGGEAAAFQLSSPWASARRLTLVLISLTLAVALMALDAPVADAKRGDGNGNGRGNEAARVIRHAKSNIGARFRIGSEGPRFFDCSGFVYRSFQRAGLLSRIGGSRKRAAGYYAWFRKRGLVSRSNPRAGDLIVWTKKGRIAHIGIYMHGNRAISALTSGVRTHRVRGLNTKFQAYLHVRLSR